MDATVGEFISTRASVRAVTKRIIRTVFAHISQYDDTSNKYSALFANEWFVFEYCISLIFKTHLLTIFFARCTPARVERHPPC